MTRYDWKRFTELSDTNYKKARDNGDIDEIKNHNILKGGMYELSFIEMQCKAYFRKNIRKGKALDIACGIGYMSKCMAQKGHSVVGFDLNQDAIAIANDTYLDIDFFVSDASTPIESIRSNKYDLVLAREVHCFSRINDEIYQENLVKMYLDLLRPGGVLVIAHSRHGADTNYPSISYSALNEKLDQDKYLTAGPHFLFLFKHLRLIIFPPARILIAIQSFLTKILAILTGRRWIEYFMIYKQ